MKAIMKTILVLVGCISLAPIHAQSPKAAAEGPSVADTIKQIEHDWVDAMIAGDIEKLNQIVADEWVEGYPGKAATKAGFLASIKAGKNKLVACDFGPRDVQVFGSVAMLQGSVRVLSYGRACWHPWVSISTTHRLKLSDCTRCYIVPDITLPRRGKWCALTSSA